MTWEETIKFIRTKPEYQDLVKYAYYDKDLRLNVENFGKDVEFHETINFVKHYLPSAINILDIGAGNGVSAVNFALQGYEVTAVEPDSSNTVGANAIRHLKAEFKLDNLTVIENFAEEINFEDGSFDIVYVRQAMHHAYDLQKFISECARVLKTGGILLTIRDHVIFNQKDKEWFLASHPLHKFYGGENAFTSGEYKNAMITAGLNILEEIKYYDSPINYFPIAKDGLEAYELSIEKAMKANLTKRLGFFSKIPGLFFLYKLKNGYAKGYLKEKQVPGRMYSYIAKKQ